MRLKHQVCGGLIGIGLNRSWRMLMGRSPTPTTNLLYGLAEAIDMLHEEGLDVVFARHDRHAAATAARCRHGDLRFCVRNRGIFPVH